MSEKIITLLDPKNAGANQGVPTLAPSPSARNLYQLFALQSGDSCHGNAISGFSSLCQSVKEGNACLIKYERASDTLYALAPIEKAQNVVELINDTDACFQNDEAVGWMVPDTQVIISAYLKPLMQVCRLADMSLCDLPTLDKSLSYAPEAGEWQAESKKLMGQLARIWGREVKLAYDDSVLTVKPGGQANLVPTP